MPETQHAKQLVVAILLIIFGLFESPTASAGFFDKCARRYKQAGDRSLKSTKTVRTSSGPVEVEFHSEGRETWRIVTDQNGREEQLPGWGDSRRPEKP